MGHRTGIWLVALVLPIAGCAEVINDRTDATGLGGDSGSSGGTVGAGNASSTSGGATSSSGGTSSGGTSSGGTASGGASSGGTGGASSGGTGGGAVGTGDCTGTEAFVAGAGNKYAAGAKVVDDCGTSIPCTGLTGQYEFSCTDEYNCGSQDPGTTNWGSSPWAISKQCNP